MKEQAWVVACEPETILFGYATEEEFDKKHPIMKRVRIPEYFPDETKGYGGLVKNGPAKGSRIGPPMDEVKILGKVYSIAPCSEKAVKIWEQGEWTE